MEIWLLCNKKWQIRSPFGSPTTKRAIGFRMISITEGNNLYFLCVSPLLFQKSYLSDIFQGLIFLIF